MPVNRCVLFEQIGDAEDDFLAFPEPEQRTGEAAVDGEGVARAAADFDGSMPDRKIEGIAGDLENALVAGARASRPGGQKARRACGEPACGGCSQ